MARRAAVGRRFARVPRRGVDWTGVVSTSDVSLAASSKLLVATFVLSNPGQMETLTRVRGRISVTGTVPVVGALGMGIFNDVAVGAGIASLPDPVTEIADNFWPLWVPIVSRSTAEATVEFDSKGQRKIEEGNSIALILANANASAAMSFFLSLRILTKYT